jgi:hypothetical protein
MNHQHAIMSGKIRFASKRCLPLPVVFDHHDRLVYIDPAAAIDACRPSRLHLYRIPRPGSHYTPSASDPGRAAGASELP